MSHRFKSCIAHHFPIFLHFHFIPDDNFASLIPGQSNPIKYDVPGIDHQIFKLVRPFVVLDETSHIFSFSLGLTSYICSAISFIMKKNDLHADYFHYGMIFAANSFK